MIINVICEKSGERIDALLAQSELGLSRSAASRLLEEGRVTLNGKVLKKSYICSDGEIYRTITKGYANIICDNVYRHASKGRYYQCASDALSQITVLLDGGKIARPMKLITGVLLSLLLSCILNYWMVTMTLGVDVPEAAALAGGVIGAVAVTDAASKITSTKRVYSPPAKSSGGGGGGGFSGGGGGGFSGGGGGHGF